MGVHSPGGTLFDSWMFDTGTCQSKMDDVNWGYPYDETETTIEGLPVAIFGTPPCPGKSAVFCSENWLKSQGIHLRNPWSSSRDPFFPPSWRSLRRARIRCCQMLPDVARCHEWDVASVVEKTMKAWDHGIESHGLSHTFVYSLCHEEYEVEHRNAWDWRHDGYVTMGGWWLGGIWTWMDWGHIYETWWLSHQN